MPNWGTPAGAFYGGSSFNVTKSSKNPAAAAKFIEFLATNPEAIKARGNTGSAFLAFPGLTPVAQQAYDASYFGNDIYAVFDKAYASISPGWQWGPSWDITNTALKDAYGKLTTGGTVLEAVDTAQTRNGGRTQAERPLRQGVGPPGGLASFAGQPRQRGDHHGEPSTHKADQPRCADPLPLPQAQCSLSGTGGRTAALFLAPFFAVFASPWWPRSSTRSC